MNLFLRRSRAPRHGPGSNGPPPRAAYSFTRVPREGSALPLSGVPESLHSAVSRSSRSRHPLPGPAFTARSIRKSGNRGGGVLTKRQGQEAHQVDNGAGGYDNGGATPRVDARLAPGANGEPHQSSPRRLCRGPVLAVVHAGQNHVRDAM
jgi:hypothetical protein